MHVSKSNHNVISHDPSTHVVEKPSVPPQKKIPVAVLAVLGFALVAVGAVWYLNGMSFNFKQEETQEFVVEPIDETVIAVVGSENIYGEDLKYKKTNIAQSMLTPELESELIDRLIEESIILQAGAEEDIINLSESVFNSPLKNQQERQKLITQVTNTITEQAAYKQGSYVSIWFMNEEPGPIGYEEGKRIALEKLTALHNAVTNGSMTMKQAGDAIKNDNSLAQVDPSYVTNAYGEFDSSVTERVFFDSNFNETLLALEEGDITDITVIQDHPESNDTLPKMDALYVFGQVSKVKTEGPSSFSAWLTEKTNNYEIIKQ